MYVRKSRSLTWYGISCSISLAPCGEDQDTNRAKVDHNEGDLAALKKHKHIQVIVYSYPQTMAESDSKMTGPHHLSSTLLKVIEKGESSFDAGDDCLEREDSALTASFEDFIGTTLEAAQNS